MTQSRTMSLVESVANVIVGYVFAIVTQLLVLPLFGIEAALSEHLAIGLVFSESRWRGGTCCGGCLNAGDEKPWLATGTAV